VDTLWPTLVEFLLRLSFGLAMAMLVTRADWVTSGFFRVHLWVLLGLGTLTSLAIYSRWDSYEHPAWALGQSVAAAVACYFGAVIWMYESRAAGKIALGIVATLLALAAGSATLRDAPAPFESTLVGMADFPTGAAVLGFFLAAMLLGHWYLNNPGMKLQPLKVLIGLGAFSLAARAVVCGTGLAHLAAAGELPTGTIGWSLVAFRWLAGLIGPGVMAYLTWQTLKIPNTQSATGILYAAVTLTFLGELTSQLLSRNLPVPV